VLINDSLAAALTSLTEALDDAGLDIADTLARVAGDARAAVDSYLGLSLVMIEGGEPLELTVLDEAGAGDIQASLLFPLAPPDAGVGRSRSAVVLYAATPGAFVDLAADLVWLTEWDPSAFVLDAHLVRPDAEAGIARLVARSTVNQALGILIARGHNADEALDALDRAAAGSGTDRLGAAREVIASLGRAG
jgi:hypothetical protein